MILVSACLAGEKCRYDGKDNGREEIIAMVKAGTAIPVCPEVLGGLPTPRIPCEQIYRDKHLCVMNKEHTDCTEAFNKGARKTLEIAQQVGAKKAILKAKSPSCGKGVIYDGTFTGQLIDGIGITAKLLEENGITVEVL